MPVIPRHAALLTPWEQFAARWLGWQYARIWVKCKGEGWYFLTVRVRDGAEAMEIIGLTHAYYQSVVLDGVRMAYQKARAAHLTDFEHFMLTERAEL